MDAIEEGSADVVSASKTTASAVSRFADVAVDLASDVVSDVAFDSAFVASAARTLLAIL